MSINLPRSAKIKIAIVHFDYRVIDLSAIVNCSYKFKIWLIERAIKKQKEKPDLIIFPEGSCSDYLLIKANEWARKWSVNTICGTMLDSRTKRIVCKVITPNGPTEFEKRDLSPYDTHYSSIKPKRGLKARGSFEINITDLSSNPYVVKVSVLICYDLRNRQYWPKSAFGSAVDDPDACHLLIVPMYDKHVSEPRKLAHELAQSSYWIRTLLVNKAFFNVELQSGRLINHLHKKANLLSIFPLTLLRDLVLVCDKKFGEFIKLNSSVHGPFNDRDCRFLKEEFGFEPDINFSLIWKSNKEGVLIGDYEVGVPFTNDNRDESNSGFNYSGFSWMPIGLGSCFK